VRLMANKLGVSPRGLLAFPAPLSTIHRPDGGRELAWSGNWSAFCLALLL